MLALATRLKSALGSAVLVGNRSEGFIQVLSTRRCALAEVQPSGCVTSAIKDLVTGSVGIFLCCVFSVLQMTCLQQLWDFSLVLCFSVYRRHVCNKLGDFSFTNCGFLIFVCCIVYRRHVGNKLCTRLLT